MYLSTRDRVKPCQVIALTRKPIPRPASPRGISISMPSRMQRRLGVSLTTTPERHAANRTARIGGDKIKHRRVGMDRYLGRTGSRTPGDKDGGGGNSNDKKIVQSGDETDIPSPLSSRASSSAEIDQDMTTTSANSSSSSSSGSRSSDESGNSSSSSSIAGMTSETVRPTMPPKNLTVSRKKRSVLTAIACRQLAAATSKQ
ncbi:unnamed protein product, partial [Ectocarpus sp. 4 AP-2014]